jgi:hypothetical protein
MEIGLLLVAMGAGGARRPRRESVKRRGPRNAIRIGLVGRPLGRGLVRRLGFEHLLVPGSPSLSQTRRYQGSSDGSNDRASTRKSLETAIGPRRSGCACSLHTREVGGSKPPAPIASRSLA